MVDRVVQLNGCRAFILVESILIHVPNDSNDLEKLIEPRQMKVLTQRISIGKILTLEPVIDHCHETRMDVVLLTDESASKKPNTHCLQIAGPDEIVQRVGHVASG